MDDLELIEKICGEMALAYFKAMIRKREIDVRLSIFSL